MGAAKNIMANEANRHSVLIIDDDAEWTYLLKLFFRDKYEVEVVNSACNAVEAARKRQPSVIIVDLVMPTIDGFGVIHRLNDASEKPIPTILLTGWKTAEVEECAAAVGCAAVLAKPIELDALDAVVSSLMNGASAVSATVV